MSTYVRRVQVSSINLKCQKKKTKDTATFKNATKDKFSKGNFSRAFNSSTKKCQVDSQ